MATIIRSSLPIEADIQIDISNSLATNFWGDLADERIFVLPFWRAAAMFSADFSNEIALKVYQINDPNQTFGEWVIFDPSEEDDLADPVQAGVYYFILSREIFFGPYVEGGTQLQGMYYAVTDPQNYVIRAQLGKIPDDNIFLCHFLVAECKIEGPGGGGGGVISGARIPRS